jgi:hypothetical protein
MESPDFQQLTLIRFVIEFRRLSVGRFMKLSQRPPRTPSILSDSIHHQLNLYAVAATAAGIRMLAVAQPAEVKIVAAGRVSERGRVSA